MERVQVGGLNVDGDEAFEAASKYLDPVSRTYSFPAYDLMATGSGPNELNDGDLLAPVLLNARLSVRGFYTLQEHRATWQSSLADLPDDVDLADADDDLCEQVGRLYAPLGLDGLPGVRGTTLAKVLHRKRPRLIPLYDSELFYVYVLSGKDAPIERARHRPWEQFMVLFCQAVRADLNHPSAVLMLDALAAGGRGPVTRLRAWDTIAWWAGKDHAGLEIDPPP